MKKFFYEDFKGHDNCGRCPNCGTDCSEDGLQYKTKFLFPYSLLNSLYKWLQGMFWQFRHFVPWPLNKIPHAYVRKILFCENCKTKSIAPKNEKELYIIKSKAQYYHKGKSPNWVDEKGFIKCPECGSHNARNFWGFGGFSGHTVYLKCFDCKHDDKEHGVFVSSGL